MLEKNSLTLTKCTAAGLALASTSTTPGFPRKPVGSRSVHSGEIRGGPARKAGTVAWKLVSPAPNERLPFEFTNTELRAWPWKLNGLANATGTVSSSPMAIGVPRYLLMYSE